jgi:hypothetical protein
MIQYKFLVSSNTRFSIIHNLKMRLAQLDKLADECKVLQADSTYDYYNKEVNELKNTIEILEKQNDIVY